MHPEERSPPQGPVPVPVLFSMVLDDGVEDLAPRLAEARQRWLTLYVESDTPPRRRWELRWTAPAWLSLGVGSLLFLAGLAVVAATARQSIPERDQYVVPGPTSEMVLRFVNEASEDQLRRAGVYPRGVDVIVEGRPFPTLAALDAAPGIGAKTLAALRRAAQPPPGG